MTLVRAIALAACVLLSLCTRIDPSGNSATAQQRKVTLNVALIDTQRCGRSSRPGTLLSGD